MITDMSKSSIINFSLSFSLRLEVDISLMSNKIWFDDFVGVLTTLLGSRTWLVEHKHILKYCIIYSSKNLHFYCLF